MALLQGRLSLGEKFNIWPGDGSGFLVSSFLSFYVVIGTIFKAIVSYSQGAGFAAFGQAKPVVTPFGQVTAVGVSSNPFMVSKLLHNGNKSKRCNR